MTNVTFMILFHCCLQSQKVKQFMCNWITVATELKIIRRLYLPNYVHDILNVSKNSIISIV